MFDFLMFLILRKEDNSSYTTPFLAASSGEAVSAQLLQDDEGNYNIKYSPVEAG